MSGKIDTLDLNYEIIRLKMLKAGVKEFLKGSPSVDEILSETTDPDVLDFYSTKIADYLGVDEKYNDYGVYDVLVDIYE